MSATRARQSATPSEDAPPRRQRADAERNRRALLDAAVQVFGERGLDATVAEIAARAGVGQGTAFRHFPTKEQLIAATVRDMLDRITATARELLDEPDPLLALRTLLHSGSQLMVSNQGFKSATANSLVHEDPDVIAANEQLLQVAAQMLTRAQDRGAIRPDVTPEDIPLLLCAVSATDIAHREHQPALWERYFEIVFSGICTDSSAAPPATLAASAPTSEELRRLKASGPPA
ncbi:MAG: TetR/AcrR family transcriptional regulator [Solirubrobacteraceae bacterium]